jgi:hypothetical protein
MRAVRILPELPIGGPRSGGRRSFSRSMPDE